MIFLFEDYQYNSKYLGKWVEFDRQDGFNIRKASQKDGEVPVWVKINGVGYLHSRQPVFVLPKVFVQKDKTTGECFAFGEKISAKGEDVFGNGSGKFKDSDPARKFLSGLGLWLYSAIDKYRKESDALKNGVNAFDNFESVKFKQNERFSTLPDIVSSMEMFYKKNQSLFVFVAKCKLSGNHKIDWHKTISRKTPILQNGAPIYMETVNKIKAFDLDDRLLVLYFSAMNYIQSVYGLTMPKSEFYQPLKVHEVQRLMEDERGVRELRRIKYKYFDDRLLKLYNIMENFFRWGAEFFKKDSKAREYLIVNSFNNVFEAMIDELVGDPEANIQKLKHNNDDKRIDHLYKERSLVFAADDGVLNNKIWHIGDSKYYREDRDLGTTSIAKQFTYAKNLIQDFFSPKYFEKKGDGKIKGEPKPVHKGIHYRDDLTEGYNVTPNFFIRGYIPSPEGENAFSFDDRENYLRQNKNAKGEYSDALIDYDAEANGTNCVIDDDVNGENKSLWDIRNRHFENRLFDRDTLLLQVYNVNFLYVLKAYTSPGASLREQFKKEAHDLFREKFLYLLDDKYAFWLVWPKKKDGEDCKLTLKKFVDSHFRTLQGKMFRSPDMDNCLIIALEKDVARDPQSVEFWADFEDDCRIILPVSPRELWDDAVYVRESEKALNVPEDVIEKLDNGGGKIKKEQLREF